MVLLILFLDVVEDLKCLLCRCRLHHHFLEATLKRPVFLDVLAVFIKGRSADTLYLASGQSRLEDVGGVHGAGCASCPHNGVEFVDEQYHVRILGELVENSLDAFLKLATVFGACHERGHVKPNHPFVEKDPRHLFLYDTERETLHYR